MVGPLTQLLRKTGLRRQHVAAARLCCERHLLATAGPRRTRNFGRILCYHSLGQPAFGVNDVTARNFRRHLELALKEGWRFVPASSIAATGGGSKELAITFDDGLKSVLTSAAPILSEYQIPWSVFIVTDWSDGKAQWAADHSFLDWRDIERLAKSGAEIGSHSVTHPNFSRISEAQTLDELGESRRVIADRVGLTVDTFAIPLGQSGNWTRVAADAARGLGYRTIYAQAEDTRPANTVARTFVTRFDSERVFRAALGGAFDRWEEWI
jgi:peptidoglycan/xylan/chitin deacetylase (PgdA/CDA1 family)